MIQLILMRRTILLLAMLLMVPGHVAAQSGALLVPPGQQVAGSIATAGQPISVDGEVLGDVTTWSGDIHVSGHVGGDVVSYSGAVVLAAGAQVDGNVLSVVGTVLPAADTRVAGQVIDGDVGGGAVADLLQVLAPLPPGAPSVSMAVPRVAFSFAFLLLLLVLSTASTLIWPRRTAGASRIFLAAPWRSLVVGLLTIFLVAALLLPLGTLLALTLVGLPLIPLLLLLLHLPFASSLGLLGQALGQRLTGSSPERATPLGVLLLLLPPTILGSFAPIWGLALFYVIASAGLGAAALSRAGTMAP